MDGFDFINIKQFLWRKKLTKLKVKTWGKNLIDREVAYEEVKHMGLKFYIHTHTIFNTFLLLAM